MALVSLSASFLATMPMNAVAAPARVYVAVVRAANGHVWSHYSNRNGWHDLGGTTQYAPAVVRNRYKQTYYVMSGHDHRLYVRSDATGWRVLSSYPTSCTALDAAFWDGGNGPSTNGALGGSRLDVACRWTNGKYYYAMSAGGSSWPKLGAWHPINTGSLSTHYGPEVVPGGYWYAEHTFGFVGPAYRSSGQLSEGQYAYKPVRYTSNVWAYNDTQHPANNHDSNGMDCTAQPSLALVVGHAGNGGFEACRGPNGHLSVRDTYNASTPPPSDMGLTVVGKAAVVVWDYPGNSAATAIVVGSDGHVRVSDVVRKDDNYYKPGTWTLLPGVSATSGVSAALVAG